MVGRDGEDFLEISAFFDSREGWTKLLHLFYYEELWTGCVVGFYVFPPPPPRIPEGFTG